MSAADDRYRLCLGHAAPPRKQFTAQHSGDGLQWQYSHAEAGSLLAVVDSIGECSTADCTEALQAPRGLAEWKLSAKG